MNKMLENKLIRIVSGDGAICSDSELDALNIYLSDYDDIVSIQNINRVGTLDTYFVGRLDTQEIINYRDKYCAITN